MISDATQRLIVSFHRLLYLQIENRCFVGSHFALLSVSENEIPGTYQRAMQTVLLQVLPATIQSVQSRVEMFISDDFTVC